MSCSCSNQAVASICEHLHAVASSFKQLQALFWSYCLIATGCNCLIGTTDRPLLAFWTIQFDTWPFSFGCFGRPLWPSSLNMTPLFKGSIGIRRSMRPGPGPKSRPGPGQYFPNFKIMDDRAMTGDDSPFGTRTVRSKWSVRSFSVYSRCSLFYNISARFTDSSADPDDLFSCYFQQDIHFT